jgi:hypothetical protein
MAVCMVYSSRDVKDVFEKALAIGEKELKNGYVVTVEKDAKGKTIWQLRTFYALLHAYFESGCSSFSTEEELKIHYKTRIGLARRKRIVGLSPESKNMVKQALEFLPLPSKEKTLLEDTLDGNALEIVSFRDATASQMSQAINIIIEDVNSSGASTYPKCQDILEGLIQNQAHSFRRTF